MKQPSENKRFLRIAIPLTAVLFFCAATLSFRLPAIRLSCAKTAYASGAYSRTVRLLKNDRSDEATELYDAAQLALAEEALASGDDAAAEAILSALPETERVKTLRKELDYRAAVRLFEAGDYSGAADAMRALDGYRESLRYWEEARYALAEQLYESGDARGAIEALLAIGSEGSLLRAQEIAIELTGVEDADCALNAALGRSEEDVRQQEQMSSLIGAAPSGRIAAGYEHTVGLCADGTAVAAGDDAFGQCGVSDWNGLIAVAAGAYHSVGLRSDGTVVAVGDNRYGQCEVSDWKDVTAIAAGAFDTVALTADGRILFTGFHDFSETVNWPNDLVSIAAGGYSLCAVRRNGTLLAVSPSAKAPEWEGLSSAAVGIGYSVGLFSDGTVQGHGVTLPAWERVVAICAGSTRVLALDAEGTVFEYAFREDDRLLPEDPVSGVLAIANGATHAALLLRDGTVICFGSNEKGECRTERWRLKND